MTQKKVTKAIFPVGGLGTRFLPATKALPKEMLPVASKPLIQHVFEEARDAGIEEFLFITGRNKNAIANHFDHSYELQTILNDKDKIKELELARGWLPHAGQIAFVRQQVPLGLGHAVWCARRFIGNEPFAVLLADELLLGSPNCMQQMIELYQKTDGNIIGVTIVDRIQSSCYGMIDPDHTMNDGVIKIRGMVEKPLPHQSPSNIAITGRYILQPQIFKYLENASLGAGGEIQLTDAMNKLLATDPFYGLVFEGKRFDCGNQSGLLEANIAYSLADPETREHTKNIINRYR